MVRLQSKESRMRPGLGAMRGGAAESYTISFPKECIRSGEIGFGEFGSMQWKKLPLLGQ